MLDPHQNTVIADIALAIAGASVAGFAASSIRLPLVLGYLFAGLVMGPNLGFGIIKSSVSIDLIAEIGLALLMFILGLEIDIRKLLRAGRTVLISGMIQFFGCALVAVLVSYYYGFRNSGGHYELTYLAIMGALSSTLLVVKILSDRREIDSLTSRITLGILVMQDLWAITFLSVQRDLAELSASLVFNSLGKALILVVVALGLARFSLPWILNRCAKHTELMLLVTLSWCLGVAGFAKYLALSVEMGALIAGVTVASFPYHGDMAAKVGSLRDFFVTLFFVSLGMKIAVPDRSGLEICAILVSIGIFSRLVTVYPSLYALKYGLRASLTPAINLAQLSEFSLVLSSIGLSLGHISQNFLAATILAVVISFLLSSILIPQSYNISRIISGFFRNGGHTSESGTAQPESVVEISTVILGFHREASSLIEEISVRHGATVKAATLIVDFNPETHKVLVGRGYQCRYADISHFDVLQTLGLRDDQTIVCTVPDYRLKGTSNFRLLKNILAISPNAKVVVTADTKDDAIKLYKLGASYVFCPRIISSYHLADMLERLATPEVEGIKQGGLAFFSRWNEVLP